MKEQTVGTVIIACTALALLWANSPFRASYEAIGAIHHIVNDGLMVLFFFVVGLEIKRELMDDSAAGRKHLMLPIVAALSGMLIPALIYMVFNIGTPQARGWAVPVATDIAFALGIIAFFSSRVPPALKLLVAAIAIADDLFSVVIIAVFYAKPIDVVWVTVAVAILVFVYYISRSSFSSVVLLVISGLALWLCVLHSGIHATVAGVAMAFVLPASSGLRKVEHSLQTVVNAAIVPLFVIVNAGVAIDASLLGAMNQPLSLGIVAGLLLGKPLGIVGAVWLALRLRVAELPKTIAMKHIIAAGLMCGIGFTMSLFVADLAFDVESDLALAKISILAASVLAAVLGSIALSRLPKLQSPLPTQ
ncbi:MAG: Na+/H+ antiporter NhaA [bacterium]|nr:Na+/H+ antiporter NhaA [bacterium]